MLPHTGREPSAIPQEQAVAQMEGSTLLLSARRGGAALFGLTYHVDLKTAAREPTDVDTMYMPADPDENPRRPKE